MLIALAVLSLTPLAFALPEPPADDLIAGPAGGPWRRLFLDAMTVEQHSGLQRVFHQPRKHEANPVLRADRPWEQDAGATGPYLYGTVLWDEGKLRMWYHCQYKGAYLNCLAESADGISWSKPDLGIVTIDGSTDNNVVLGACQRPDENPPFKGQGECHNPSVIKRPWEMDPQKRYVLLCYGQEYRWARVAFSPDGLHWSFDPGTKDRALFSSSDVLNFFWDPYRSRYVGTWKAGCRRGRSVGVVLSDDALNWRKPVEEPVFVPDDLDPDATQVYGMPVFPYQGLYIGLPWIYNARWFKYGGYSDERLYESELGSPCTMDVQLAWSWDLINWTRPPQRDPFIPRGEEGRFDSHMNYTARAPVQVGDELYFYYGGFDGPHNAPHPRAAIGLAVLRLDGFCSMRAGAEEGRLISRREPMTVPQVTINARTGPDGYVLAELLDRDDRVIAGFSRDDCIAFTGDSVRHVLRWRTAQLPTDMQAPDKKIRFILKNADLYSYLPDQTPSPVSVIYDPAANGGLLPSASEVPAAQRFAMNGDPAGFSIARRAGLTFVDMHSVGERKTSACFSRSDNWTDEQDWALEAWLRVVDEGNEPVYGLAVQMRRDWGAAAGIYLREGEVGLITHREHDYRTLGVVPMDTTDGFHWYRMAHTGGPAGTVTLQVDGREIASVPYAELDRRVSAGWNVVFGPNASHCEGRLQVAKFGYSTGSARQILGPVPPSSQ